MKVIYIIFFAVLNLLIFSHLTKKVMLSSKVKRLFAVFLFMFTLIHFVNPSNLSISNEVFLYYSFLVCLSSFFIMDEMLQFGLQ